MAGGHTKSRPDNVFGSIRRHVDGRADVLSVVEMIEAIEASEKSNLCVIYPVYDV